MLWRRSVNCARRKRVRDWKSYIQVIVLRFYVSSRDGKKIYVHIDHCNTSKKKWYLVYFSKAMVPKSHRTACWFWLSGFITTEYIQALRSEVNFWKTDGVETPVRPRPDQSLSPEPRSSLRVIMIVQWRHQLTDITVAMGRGSCRRGLQGWAQPFQGVLHNQGPSVTDAPRCQAWVAPFSVFQPRIWGQKSFIF